MSKRVAQRRGLGGRGLGGLCGLALLFACQVSQSEPPADPVVAIYQVPRDGTEPTKFYALPFPNNIRRHPDGRIDLGSHQRPNPLIALFLDSASEHQRGFGQNSPAIFRFSQALDSSSLPKAPATSASDQPSVYIVNVDDQSPRFGTIHPTNVYFQEYSGIAIGSHWLSILPIPGFPLEPSTSYAAVVTNRVAAEDGSAVIADLDFQQVLSSASLDGELAAAQATLAPLTAWLDLPGGDERSDIVSASVFTTQDTTSIMGKIRAVIYREVAAPIASQLTAAETEATYHVFEGTYDSPIFQRGTIPYGTPADGGDIVIDDEGNPIVQATTSLRFALAIPSGTLPATGWPITIYAHGTGGDYRSFINNRTAERLAAKGIASISIDQTLHGPRNVGGNPELDFFNIQNPLSARDNTLQGALDDFQLTRLVVGFSESLDGALTRFDDQRIFFFGHSQGALTGIPFISYEPKIKGAVLSGGGGNLTLSLLSKTEPIDIAGLLAALIPDKPLNEFNPILGIIQAYLDRSDSINYARLLAEEPPAGRTALNIFLGLGITDTFTPVPSIKALATAIGTHPLAPMLEPIEGLELRGLAPLEAPISANHTSGRTAVVAQYRQAPGSNGHFVLFQVAAAQTQSIEFLASLCADGDIATVVAP